MKFRTTLELAGKTATGMRVPADVVESFGVGKRPPVTVTINGYTYRSTVAVYGGQYLVGVAAEHREKAGVSAGDELDVEMELDTAPREVAVPPDFAEALDADEGARRFFDGLNYSNKRRLVEAIEGVKSAETRQRKIATTVERLREGRA
jgi:hypothetical protein